MSEQVVNENVAATILQICTNKEGELDIKCWNGTHLQRCKVRLDSGRDEFVRIGAAGLQVGMNVVLPRLRSFPNQHQEGKWLHASDTAKNEEGGLLPPIMGGAQSAPAPAATGGIPGGAPQPQSTPRTQNVPQTQQKYPSAVRKAAVEQMHKDALEAAQKAGLELGLGAVEWARSHVVGYMRNADLWEWYLEAANAQRQSDEHNAPPPEDDSELPPNGEIPF